MIPYGRQEISQADIDAVTEVLRSDFLTQGPVVPRFEQAVAKKVGAAHAVAVNSATSALHVAVAALDVGPGDVVWTSPVTFVASANCARYCGADVDFVDIDPETFNMCPKALREKLEATPEASRPKVVIPVHLCGMSTPAAEIAALGREFGFRIIEDASHTVGGAYKGQPVGSCAHSDITVFSFHPVKIVTTAEGGLALTNDPGLAQRMSLLRSHGVTRDPALMTHESDGPWYYQMVELGWNYRMTEMQAALGLSQLDRLGAFVARRNVLADSYDSLLSGLPVTAQARQAETLSAFHLYVVRLDLSQTAPHRTVFERLRDAGIGVNLHYIPVHLQPYYRGLGFGDGDFPEAERYYAEAISIPLYPGLIEADQDRVVASLREALVP
ncbi:UDP-4-amino-4,6-dideoxy-N-acetyl-beta-L-altrosamine transaminase [Aliiruegeria haliotis]|uniref:UDP-4-amino-4, 6-dideoxy-N-acetyl-beta-L-altrosamine transaminase n=1 Tax=Aliiruegeria haliotis TaxID=1280846 RepID=A0A2T0RNL7_9RHOB|nr:UDP-4-amino-4,6-dideoxy-N-acetyl-beta-L-altrosamine transaminase [Aliiruegeria haliotis]PRY22703.1 UDP-4-amino-4,6-dideoxy-N-acetyl-beta-L-altrosamine transaminase [Aliiruegeria haliotis]